ncbi:MAG: Restriction endonuclease [Patescibacteria group bacterium]|nr:Restriction endonuclease [Patescibacteria group bacterium]
MAIPKFDETMLPILRVLSDGKPRQLIEVSGILENEFGVTDEEREQTVSNGYTKFYDRVSWGRTYLKKAGLIVQESRGSDVCITEEGLKIINAKIDKMDIDFLKRYPSFMLFVDGGTKTPEEINNTLSGNLSPQDMIDQGFARFSNTLKSDLLEKLQSTNPYFFERVALILFQKMGYGDFQETSKSGDGGIDGVISQDKLGLEKIYIQAKRFASTNKVREPEIRNFIGAMSGDVSKGIFVTTSSFDESAVQKAKNASHKIVLIDGDALTDLMIKYGVGVQTASVYELKEIDTDFFEVS